MHPSHSSAPWGQIGACAQEPEGTFRDNKDHEWRAHPPAKAETVLDLIRSSGLCRSCEARRIPTIFRSFCLATESISCALNCVRNFIGISLLWLVGQAICNSRGLY